MAQVLFQTIAREWWELFLRRGAADYAEESWRRLEREVMPALGLRPLGAIDAPAILAVLRRVEARGAPAVARKLKSHVSQIMRYGIACGHIFANPARDLGWALTPLKHTPRAAILEPRKIGLLMRDIAALRSTKRRCALQLAALTFVRPGELCGAAWQEFDADEAVWRIPAARMKMKRPHLVPLSRQAREVLREIRPVTGGGVWLFPSRWDAARPESGRVLNAALRRMGYGPEVMTAHGFRAMAATILSEEGRPSEVIERQLAHVDKNAVRAAYQRSEFLAERRKMMQAWGDYLDMRCARAILGKKGG